MDKNEAFLEQWVPTELEIEAWVQTANPLNDALFKYLFASKGNKANLLRLLNDILEPERRVVDVEYLDRENSPLRFSGKRSYLDVLAQAEDGRLFHVEVQTADENNFMERATYYSAYSVGTQLYAGEDYSALKPVVFVSILKFSLFPDKPLSWRSTHRLLDLENHKCYNDILEFHFLELPKLERRVKAHEVEDTGLSRLLRYLGRIGGKEEMERLAERDAGIERLRAEERSFFQKPGNLTLYRIREREEIDYRNALKRAAEKAAGEAEARGEARGRAEAARRMLNAHLSPEQISEFTGLSLSEVEALRRGEAPV